jgi:hypothetical protein
VRSTVARYALLSAVADASLSASIIIKIIFYQRNQDAFREGDLNHLFERTIRH